MADSHFNENINFKLTKNRLIEYFDDYDHRIGLIDHIDNTGSYHVIIVLPAIDNGKEDIINKTHIDNYLTKNGWSKIHKYLTDYSKAKEKWHHTRDSGLTKHEIDIVASENDVNAYMRQYRKQQITSPKTTRSTIKKVVKKCRCNDK